MTLEYGITYTNTKRGRKLLTEDNFVVINVRPMKDASGVTNTLVEISRNGVTEFIRVYRPTIEEAVKITGLNLPLTSNVDLPLTKQEMIEFFANAGIAFEIHEFQITQSSRELIISFLEDALSYRGKIKVADLAANVLLLNQGGNLIYQDTAPIQLNT